MSCRSARDERDWRGNEPLSCSLETVSKYIAAAIAALIAAIALSLLWVEAVPLFAAAGLVATVSLYLIPHIKQALLDYATCRGPGNCTISDGINTLGQLAVALSVGTFVLAGLLQVTALGFLGSWILAVVGGTLEVLVKAIVFSGVASCVTVVIGLLGVLTNAIAFRDCMDQAAKHINPGPIKETR